MKYPTLSIKVGVPKMKASKSILRLPTVRIQHIPSSDSIKKDLRSWRKEVRSWTENQNVKYLELVLHHRKAAHNEMLVELKNHPEYSPKTVDVMKHSLKRSSIIMELMKKELTKRYQFERMC